MRAYRIIALGLLASVVVACPHDPPPDGPGPIVHVAWPSGPPVIETLSTDEIRRLVEASPCDLITVGGGESDYEPPAGAPEFRLGYPRISGGTLVYLDRKDSVQTYLRPHPAVAVALTGTGVFENEAHDCQRLVTSAPTSNTHGTFGPLVGLFPIRDQLRSTHSWTAPTAIASVYNWGDFNFQTLAYDSLDIADGWSCLWIQGDGEEFRAAIHPTREPCPESTDVPTDFPLAVTVARHVVHDSLTATEASGLYPPSVRWNWDFSAAMHYIGIRCGSAWCMIAPPHMYFRPHLAGPVHRSIPGWYDEQLLAIPAPAGSADPVVPGPLGGAFPDSVYWRIWNQPIWVEIPSDLKHEISLVLMRDKLEETEGAPIAQLEVQNHPRPIGVYDEKFSLSISGGGTGRSTIRVRGAVPELEAVFHGDETNVGTLTFIEESGHSASGSVRWRWQETDEKVWASCEEGCCTVGP